MAVQGFKPVVPILFLMWIVSLSLLIGSTNAQTLLIDTFEHDTVGKKPSKWQHVKGNAFDKNPEAVVVEDPTKPGNKVYSQTGLRKRREKSL